MTPIEVKALELVCLGFIVSVAYFWVMRRAAEVVQPARLKLAALGERVLSDKPSEERAQQTLFYLDNAFSGRVMPVAALLLPFVAAWSVAKHVFGGFRLTARSHGDDDRLSVLFLVSTVAANPLFGGLFLIELLVVSFVMLLLFGPNKLMLALESFIRAELAVFGRRPKLRYGALA